MEKFDFKKEYRDLYMPKTKPSVIDVPEILYITVEGRGDPNTSKDYKDALEILYGLSFTIKMSKMTNPPDGYFEYVVPPLEGLWTADDGLFDGLNVTDKNKFLWISMIRQPDFVTEKVFEDAKYKLSQKKPELPVSKAKLERIHEELCVQIMHKGSYDGEAQSIALMKEFIENNGYAKDFSKKRKHHEIYLSDPRRCAPENLRTVIRHPIRKI